MASSAYYKIQPLRVTANRPVEEESDDRIYSKHLAKVTNPSRALDTGPPQIFPHIELRLKTLQLEEDRLKKVDMENQRLLKSLLDTMERPSERLNNSNWDWQSKQSHNYVKRKRNALRIVRDNEAIVTRILQAKSHFDWHSMERDWQTHQREVRKRSRFRPARRHQRRALDTSKTANDAESPMHRQHSHRSANVESIPVSDSQQEMVRDTALLKDNELLRDEKIEVVDTLATKLPVISTTKSRSSSMATSLATQRQQQQSDDEDEPRSSVLSKSTRSHGSSYYRSTPSLASQSTRQSTRRSVVQPSAKLTIYKDL